MLTGDVVVMGNVRYVSTLATVYGSEMYYNIRSNKMEIANGRILSDNYVVLGKTLAKVDENNYQGKDAEYTTCKDCPESWSIFGKDVYITMNEYIRITHAYFKINGVIVMYIPYIILPIKKERESGLLFPNLSVNGSNGVVFQQPWFWNISPSNDMTITPSAFGNRGLGMEWQYRQVLGDRKWFELNSLQLFDSIYRPDIGISSDAKDTGRNEFRHFSDYEHHFSVGNNLNHHIYFNDGSDLDMVRDFNFFTSPKIRGSELGGGGFVDYRTSIMNMSLESYFNRNQLVKKSKTFDDAYVQILPKVSFNMEPFSLISTRYLGLHKISMTLNGDFTNFRQNHTNEGEFIRNAQRFNFRPAMNWYMGHMGPIDMKTMATLDYQHYSFPKEDEDNNFTKRAVLYETELLVEFEKIFGIALSEEVPSDSVVQEERLEDESDVEMANKIKGNESPIIGTLPETMDQYVNKMVTIASNSYKHIQQFKLKHYFLSDTEMYGSDRFERQITDTSTLNGLFDNVDEVKAKEFQLSAMATSKEIPFSNTFELQWNNSLIRKSPKRFDPRIDGTFLTNNFRYSKLAHFDLSQGLVMNANDARWQDRLTRLRVGAGISVQNNSIEATEYYFYNNTHIFVLKLSKDFTAGNIDLNFRYNSTQKYSSAVNGYQKLLGISGSLMPIEVLKFTYVYNYNLQKKQNTEKEFAVTYSPYNNCWKLEFRRESTLNDLKTSVNFLINYNNNSFQSLL